MEISEYFKDRSKLYYGHGTGAKEGGLDENIMSIFESGLMCSCGINKIYGENPSSYSTTLFIGEGSNDLYDKRVSFLNNWKHKGSKNIIVASLPKNLLFSHHIIGTLPARQYRDAAFCYSVSQEDGKQSFYLMPEFIEGCYDATHQTFIPNSNYYENLEEDKQSALFEKVKQNYKDTLLGCANNGDFKFSSFAKCQKNITEKLGEDWTPPFTEEEVSVIDQQLRGEIPVQPSESTFLAESNLFNADIETKINMTNLEHESDLSQ